MPSPEAESIATPHVLFPDHRMVALYGHPGSPALGILGELTPQQAVEEVQRRASEYQQYSAEPVVPAFEIIATVASEFPGVDGDYSNEASPEELLPFIDAITAAGGYAIVDLQPGRAGLLDQAKRYEELLKRPNVGLAIDPEWKLAPGMLPAQEVGHVSAAEINDVSAWLAQLTRENNLPHKALVIHQFQEQMVRERHMLEHHEELELVIHVDGHGSAADKLYTWDQVRHDLDPRIFPAWKNFHDEDTPMFTAEQTMAVTPQPWLITFQ